MASFTSWPAAAPVALPFVIVRAEIVTVLPELMKNIRPAWWPSMDSTLAPGPLIVTLLFTVRWPLVNVMKPLTPAAKTIVSPLFAVAIASRKLPAPLSVVLVTVIVAAHDEESVIERRLEDLLAQVYPAELFDVIVASDASTDGTDDLVEAARQGIDAQVARDPQRRRDAIGRGAGHQLLEHPQPVLGKRQRLALARALRSQPDEASPHVDLGGERRRCRAPAVDGGAGRSCSQSTRTRHSCGTRERPLRAASFRT